jgi:hypothetical protein
MVVTCTWGAGISIDPVSKQNPALSKQVLVCSVHAGQKPVFQPSEARHPKTQA